MTKKLLERLTHHAKDLEHELKSTLPEEIRKAASLGDLSENAEYEAALERQRVVQSQFRSLKSRINEIALIDMSRLPRDRVGYGSKVKLLDLDDDHELCYELVMPEDSDAKHNRISVSSPIGKSLLGKAEGDEAHVNIPSGVRNYEIMEVTPYHEGPQDL